VSLTLATLAPARNAATAPPAQPEIFAALQGEGASAGHPCVFVRLSRCNLACGWCDTAYTWNFAAHPRAANQLTLPEAEVAARIAALWPAAGGAPPRLVITGGEPLLQAPALCRLLALLPGWQAEVETNGTIPPPPALTARIDQWNVSPKLAHAGNRPDLAIRPKALAAFAALPHAWFKFVVATPGDVAEVLALAAAHALPRARILLMPEGRTSEALHARARWLAPLALAHGLALSDRLHIHLSGDTRGT